MDSKPELALLRGTERLWDWFDVELHLALHSKKPKLSTSQFVILRRIKLEHAGFIPMTRLRGQLRLERYEFTKLLRPLTAGSGLVLKEYHAPNRRNKVLTLTPKGRRFLADIESKLLTRVGAELNSFKEEDLRRVIDGLDILDGSLSSARLGLPFLGMIKEPPTPQD